MTNENMDKQMDNSVHFMFQAKGGCGKTFATSLLAQFFQKTGANIKGFDTDQENRDFYAYKGLPVRYVDVMQGKTIIEPKEV